MSDPETEQVTRIVYVSAAKQPFTTAALNVLLEKARTRNAGAAVSGMLLHEKGAFFQVLEGPPEAVLSVYERIALDPRHHRLVKLVEEHAVKRLFADWSMGYAEVSLRDLKSLPGCNDFFRAGHCYADLSAGVARELLGAFREGRFHVNPN